MIKKNNVGENLYSPEFDEKNVKLHKDYNYNKLDKFGVVKKTRMYIKMMLLLENTKTRLKEIVIQVLL